MPSRLTTALYKEIDDSDFIRELLDDDHFDDFDDDWDEDYEEHDWENEPENEDEEEDFEHYENRSRKLNCVWDDDNDDLD